eukprot:Lankesteria_metandrocarpae@DN3296_c0_g1_i1.p1
MTHPNTATTGVEDCGGTAAAATVSVQCGEVVKENDEDGGWLSTSHTDLRQSHTAGHGATCTATRTKPNRNKKKCSPGSVMLLQNDNSSHCAAPRRLDNSNPTAALGHVATAHRSKKHKIKKEHKQVDDDSFKPDTTVNNTLKSLRSRQPIPRSLRLTGGMRERTDFDIAHELGDAFVMHFAKQTNNPNLLTQRHHRPLWIVCTVSIPGGTIYSEPYNDLVESTGTHEEPRDTAMQHNTIDDTNCSTDEKILAEDRATPTTTMRKSRMSLPSTEPASMPGNYYAFHDACHPNTASGSVLFSPKGQICDFWASSLCVALDCIKCPEVTHRFVGKIFNVMLQSQNGSSSLVNNSGTAGTSVTSKKSDEFSAHSRWNHGKNSSPWRTGGFGGAEPIKLRCRGLSEIHSGKSWGCSFEGKTPRDVARLAAMRRWTAKFITALRQFEAEFKFSRRIFSTIGGGKLLWKKITVRKFDSASDQCSSLPSAWETLGLDVPEVNVDDLRLCRGGNRPEDYEIDPRFENVAVACGAPKPLTRPIVTDTDDLRCCHRVSTSNSALESMRILTACTSGVVALSSFLLTCPHDGNSEIVKTATIDMPADELPCSVDAVADEMLSVSAMCTASAQQSLLRDVEHSSEVCEGYCTPSGGGGDSDLDKLVEAVLSSVFQEDT